MMFKEQDFEPFIITQINELQNVFIIANDELLNEKQDFSNYLYRFIDGMAPQTCLRIFKYKKRIYLAYFILSNLTEPHSNRSGIYLVIGVSCSIRTFKTNPLMFGKRVVDLFEITKKTFQAEHTRTPATHIINTLWTTKDINGYLNKIDDAFHELCLNKLADDNKTISFRTRPISIKRKYNAYYMISENNLENCIIFFSIFASQAYRPFRFKFDYSNQEKYGQNTIKILFNGEAIPESITNGHFNILYIDRYYTPFINIQF